MYELKFGERNFETKHSPGTYSPFPTASHHDIDSPDQAIVPFVPWRRHAAPQTCQTNTSSFEISILYRDSGSVQDGDGTIKKS
jgi:hypothetical protein